MISEKTKHIFYIFVHYAKTIVIHIIRLLFDELYITYNNYRVYLSAKDKCGTTMFYHYYRYGKVWQNELLEQSIILHLLDDINNPIYFIDIGANYGLYSFLTAKSNKVKKIFSIEASPRTCKLLDKSIEYNNLGNKVNTLNYAITDQLGDEVFIYEHEDFSEWNQVYKSDELTKNKFTNIYKVKSTTIDTIIFSEIIGFDKNDQFLIKLDIEGSEPLALKGMTRFFNSDLDYIIITEFNADILNRNTDDGANVFAKYIWELKFSEIYHLDYKNNKIIKINELNELLQLVEQLNNSEGFDKLTYFLIVKNPIESYLKNDSIKKLNFTKTK